MENPAFRRRGHDHCIAFRRDSVLPLSLAEIQAAVEREIDSGNASAVLIVLFNEFQDLLGDDADDWRSEAYRNYDLFI